MYLVDANVLIEAKNRYYAFDIAPGFWDWLDHAHDHSMACSINAVRDELVNGNDELAEWARMTTALFRPIDQGTTRQFTPLTTWAGGSSDSGQIRLGRSGVWYLLHSRKRQEPKESSATILPGRSG